MLGAIQGGGGGGGGAPPVLPKTSLWMPLASVVSVGAVVAIAIGARPATTADGAAIPRGAVAYVGALLHPPRQLTSVVEGARVTFVPDPGGKHPLAVTDAYLDERARWTIGACPRCGLGEAFEPPSVLAAARFPGDEVIAFTAHCPMCGPPSAQSFAPA